jgi:hypothetical protein
MSGASHPRRRARRRQQGSRSTRGMAVVRMVCPSCLRECPLPEPEIAEESPKCKWCSLPLVRAEKNRKAIRCFLCAHRAVTPRGLWCKKMRATVDAEMARICEHFAGVRRPSDRPARPRRRKSRPCRGRRGNPAPKPRPPARSEIVRSYRSAGCQPTPDATTFATQQ